MDLVCCAFNCLSVASTRYQRALKTQPFTCGGLLGATVWLGGPLGLLSVLAQVCGLLAIDGLIVHLGVEQDLEAMLKGASLAENSGIVAEPSKQTCWCSGIGLQGASPARGICRQTTTSLACRWM